jgi:hypothetical protein
MEALLRAAAKDPQFKELLLSERSKAAARIVVVLDPPEAAILDSVTEEQLRAMIEAIPERIRVTEFPGVAIRRDLRDTKKPIAWTGSRPNTK